MEKILNTLSYYIEKNNYLAFALTYIVTGILILIFNHVLFSSFIEILLLIMLISCMKDLFTMLTNKKASKIVFAKAVGSTILVLIALFFIDIPKAILIMVFSTYFIFNGLIKFVSCYLMKKDKLRGIFKDFLEGFISFAFGIICFFSPKIHMNIMLYIIGGYVLLLGIDYLFDFLDQKEIHIKRIHLPLPPFIDALIPLSILQKINRLGEDKNIELDFHKKIEKVDLEIFVHVSMQGTGKLGHVDLCFDGYIISYGNYDMDTRKLRDGIGSGVVFTCPKTKYIPFCVEYSEKTIFGFGIKLSEAQKGKVKQELSHIFESLEEWKPKYVRALENDKDINKDEYIDYASMLYKNTDAKFYKFTNGKLKTFFILGNNCGALVDKILRSSGADVLKMRGIITPGTYYDFLEREYLKKDSNVVSKQIYNQGNIQKWKERFKEEKIDF
jgi:hypothetical protein